MPATPQQFQHAEPLNGRPGRFRLLDDGKPSTLRWILSFLADRWPSNIVCSDSDNSRSDADLVRLLAAGDVEALGTLIERHQASVFEVAYRTTGDRALAEDVTQETFLRVWRSADRFRGAAQFTTWLHRITVNICLDAFKKRRPVLGVVPDAPGPATDDPASILARENQAEVVRRAVLSLPERQRVAVVLSRFLGLPHREIATATGWTESAVESLLTRARVSLYRTLQEKEKP